MELPELIKIIKSEYGINQATLAREMKISPQILTDVKAGRRRFTPAMAEAIMGLFAHQPGIGWLAEALQRILAEEVKTAGQNCAQSEKSLSMPGITLPVLDAICIGDPLTAPGYSGKNAMVPESMAHLLVNDSGPYILSLDYDDYSGRLRMGDQILIVQSVHYSKEIMVVEKLGRLRLARKSITAPLDSPHAVEKEEWLALDTGKPLGTVSFAGTAVGIVAAML